MGLRCEGTPLDYEQLGFETVSEENLPICMRDVLYAARASRPDSEITCVAFRTFDDTHDLVRLGPSPELIHDWHGGSFADRLMRKELLVLSATVVETTYNSVRKVAHVLVTRVRRNGTRHSA
jgi:hypothetical protein